MITAYKSDDLSHEEFRRQYRKINLPEHQPFQVNLPAEKLTKLLLEKITFWG